MEKIAILLDSTSGLREEEAKKHEHIYMIPLYTIFGEESFKDGIDLTDKEFFKKSDELYEKTGTLPTTSQPSIGECIDMYEELLKTYDKILYISISEKMSGTYQSGVLASQEFDGKVTVVNSQTTAFGTYVPALLAAKMFEEGKSIEEAVEMIHRVIEESTLFFVVGDLKHLQRTGRIGAAAAKIGNALQLKPVLTIVDGEVTQYEKVRNIKKAHKKVISYFEDIEVTDNDYICIASADADDYLEFIHEEIAKLFPNVRIKTMDLSPVISNNTGPGTVGLFLFKNIDEIEV